MTAAPASATYRVEEAAQLLGVSPWGLYEAIRRNEPPCPVIRCGRRILVPRRPLDALLGLSEASDAHRSAPGDGEAAP